MLLPLYSFNQTETSCHKKSLPVCKHDFLGEFAKIVETLNLQLGHRALGIQPAIHLPLSTPRCLSKCQNILTSNSSHQDEVLFWFKLLTYAEGRMAVPNRMNFRKNSKRPSILPPSFSENYFAFFFIMDMAEYMQGGTRAR